jgi:hypothetical protein
MQLININPLWNKLFQKQKEEEEEKEKEKEKEEVANTK